ncbi:MAG: hypothetical protein ACLR7Z_10735 [Bilophila wadsworthia]
MLADAVHGRDTRQGRRRRVRRRGWPSPPEDFRRGSSKKQRSVIRDARGATASPTRAWRTSPARWKRIVRAQLGYIIRALCGAPATTADGAGKALSEP